MTPTARMERIGRWKNVEENGSRSRWLTKDSLNDEEEIEGITRIEKSTQVDKRRRKDHRKAKKGPTAVMDRSDSRFRPVFILVRKNCKKFRDLTEGTQTEQSGIFSAEILSIYSAQVPLNIPHYNGIPSDRNVERIDAEIEGIRTSTL
jgi:hypothetical protein